MASNSNGSASLDAVVTVSNNVSTTGDSCAWYADKSCEKPRTCFDCLNVGIVGDACGVGDIGQCLSTSERKPGETYSLAGTLSYCQSSDVVCANCRTKWLEEYAANGEVQSTALCIGESGCICLAVCEREARDSLVIQTQCPVYETAKVGSIMLVLAMGIATFIVFSMFTAIIKKLLGCAIPSLDRSQVVRRPRRSPRGPQLTLSGWKSMREKLIETEHGNGTPSAGPSGVMRIQLSTTEATSVTVEEGDGFRPGSPSRDHLIERPEDLAPALVMLR